VHARKFERMSTAKAPDFVHALPDLRRIGRDPGHRIERAGKLADRFASISRMATDDRFPYAQRPAFTTGRYDHSGGRPVQRLLDGPLEC